jgi:peroxiredoxin
MLKVGAPAPEVVLLGRPLGDWVRDGELVLYFFPKAFTPG